MAGGGGLSWLAVPAVRAEFGPTLPELLGPRVRALPRAAQVALAVVAGVLVVALATALLTRGTPSTPIVVSSPVAFNLRYEQGLRRLAPSRGESLHLASLPGRPTETFIARPLRLGAYRGDPTAALMILTPRLIDEMARTIPGFDYRGDGRARLNPDTQGYQIQYQAKIGGRTVYGRRVLLLPDDPNVPTPREGADLDLRSARSPAVPNVDAVGNNGPLQTPFRSFRFGSRLP